MLDFSSFVLNFFRKTKKKLHSLYDDAMLICRCDVGNMLIRCCADIVCLMDLRLIDSPPCFLLFCHRKKNLYATFVFAALGLSALIG